MPAVQRKDVNVPVVAKTSVLDATMKPTATTVSVVP